MSAANLTEGVDLNAPGALDINAPLCLGCHAPGPDVPLDGGYCSTCMARRRAEMCFRRKQHGWGKPCKACLFEGDRGTEHEAVVITVTP